MERKDQIKANFDRYLGYPDGYPDLANLFQIPNFLVADSRNVQ